MAYPGVRGRELLSGDQFASAATTMARVWVRAWVFTPMTNEYRERLHRRDDRVLITRVAAAERWGPTRDRTAATEAARRGLRAKFEREADPEGALSAQERARRADQLMHAHMLRMSRAAAQARRRAAR